MRTNLRRQLTRDGFTLVELLVVIAIIGVLVALLLPAIQAAREAGRRGQCSNNIKQLGLAVQNHHDAKKYLPPGSAQDQLPFGQSPGNWGSSWLVYILPFNEQQTLYDNFKFFQGSGWGTSAAHNTSLAKGAIIPTYFCPSSPLPTFCRSPHSNGPIMAPTYAGIAGAVNGLIPNFPEVRIGTPGGSAGCCSGGILSGGGVLPTSQKLGLKDITDGTANTMVCAEIGDFLITDDGTKRDFRSAAQHGWIIGWRHTNPVPGVTSANSGNATDQRSFNLITVRYNVNQKKRPGAGAIGSGTGWTNWPGNCGADGLCDNASANTPINSAHPGIALSALADGSVRTLKSTMSLNILARLATRDDANEIPNF